MIRVIQRLRVLEPNQVLTSLRKKFDKLDLLILVAVLIVGAINNFYFFITHGLQADAISDSFFQVAGMWEAQLGRPLIQILDHLRFGFTNQLLIVLVSLLFIAGAMMLIRRIFQVTNKFWLVLLTILVSVAPQFTEIYEFLYCADSYVFAFFLASVAAYAMTKLGNFEKNKKWYFGVVLATMATCGLYQAFLGCIAGLTILLAIHENFSGEKPSMVLKHFFRNTLLVLLGVCAYYIFCQIYCAILHTSLAAYKGADSFGIETILTMPKNILGCFLDFIFFFATNRIIFNSAYGRTMIYVVIFLALAAGFIVKFCHFKTERWSRIILTGFLVLIFPVGINVMNLIASGVRANLVTGVGFITTAILLVIVFNSTNKESVVLQLANWASSIAAIILIWTFIVSNTFTYVFRQQQYDHFEVIMQNIYSRVTQLKDYDEELPWMFSNLIVVDVADIDKTNGMVSTNMITWPSYDGTRRYALLLYKMMGLKITTVDYENYQKITGTKQFKEMPVYPKTGSIKIIDGTVVIKVSDEIFTTN